MNEIEKLKHTLALLKEFKVATFSQNGLYVSFDQDKVKPELNTEAVTPEPTIEGQLPVDLRLDALQDPEKVLFWSASPDPAVAKEDEPLPLTGESGG